MAGAAALALSGCVSDFNVAGPQQLLWEANLDPALEYPAVSGTAAAVSGSTLTEAGITMLGLEPGVYSWRVRESWCDDPGDVVGGEGQYPDLVVEEEEDPEPGEEGISVQTQPFRATMTGGARYHVEVRRSEPDERVACGNFSRS